MVALSTEVEDRPQRLFTRQDYHTMVESGILSEDDRVELINGKVIAMMPIGPRHAASSGRLHFELQKIYGDAGYVTSNNPIGLGDKSEPQPDVTVLRWRDDFYASSHPEAKDVLLLIEISDTSRTFDLDSKRDLYAAHGVAEYWVVEGGRKCVHVFRDPQDGHFGESRIYHLEDSIPLPHCGGRMLQVSVTGI
jgi:Uma2 family endonuclease